MQNNELIHPQLEKVYPDTVIYFQCNSTSNTKWFFGNSGKIEEATMLPNIENFMFLKVNREQHEGYYFCYGLDSKSKRRFVAKSQLIVYGKCCSILHICLY